MSKNSTSEVTKLTFNSTIQYSNCCTVMWLLTSWNVDVCNQGTEYSVLFHVNKLKQLTCSCQIEHFMFTAIKSFFLIKVAYYQKLLKLGERKPVIQTCTSMEGMLPISQKSLGLILKSIFFKLFWSWFMLSVKLSIPNISIFIYRQSEYLKALIKYY